MRGNSFQATNLLHGPRSKLERPDPTAKITRHQADGVTYYTQSGRDILHNRSGPAVIVDAGAEYQLEFEGDDIEITGPAELYLENGQLHREATLGPAIVVSEGGEIRATIPGAKIDIGAKGLVEIYMKNNRLHNESGPAISTAAKTEFYATDGVIDRDDNPAITIHQDEADLMIDDIYLEGGSEAFVARGHLHRENGPATVQKEDDELTKKYYRQGLIHNESGPAVIISVADDPDDPNTSYTLLSEEYYINNKKHREPLNGRPLPAEIVYDDSGEVSDAYCFIDDKPRRDLDQKLEF
jgi:hypothetical protein